MPNGVQWVASVSLNQDIVLNKIEFDEIYGAYNSVSLAYQHRLLWVEDRASRDAQFEFMNRHRNIVKHLQKHIHDLSVADPFEQP